jgi:DNA-binding PadR family transcriptional regulator
MHTHIYTKGNILSLTYVILGWLNNEPMTGYDLNGIIEISTRHFWTSSQSQIYRTLSKIEEKGWVQQEVILQEDRPPRKVYHITEAGQKALKAWLSSFHEPLPSRISWLIQVFFAGQISDEAIVGVLEKKIQHLQKRLAGIRMAREIVAQSQEPKDDIRDVFYWNLTIDFGEANLQAQIDWIESALERIKQKTYQNEFSESEKKALDLEKKNEKTE